MLLQKTKTYFYFSIILLNAAQSAHAGRHDKKVVINSIPDYRVISLRGKGRPVAPNQGAGHPHSKNRLTSKRDNTLKDIARAATTVSVGDLVSIPRTSGKRTNAKVMRIFNGGNRIEVRWIEHGKVKAKTLATDRAMEALKQSYSTGKLVGDVYWTDNHLNEHPGFRSHLMKRYDKNVFELIKTSAYAITYNIELLLLNNQHRLALLEAAKGAMAPSEYDRLRAHFVAFGQLLEKKKAAELPVIKTSLKGSSKSSVGQTGEPQA